MITMRAALIFFSITLAASSTLETVDSIYEQVELEALQDRMEELPSSEPPIAKVFFVCITFYGVIFSLWFLFSRLSKENPNYDNLRVGLNCMTYCACAITMHMLNKSLATTLREPSLISIAQMVVAVAFFGTMAGKQMLDSDRKALGMWCAVPTFFAFLLITGFYMYEYMSLSMLTIMRNLTPLLVLPVEMIVMPPETKPQVNRMIVLAMVCMLVGAFCYGGALEVSLVGVAFGILNMTLAATDRILQRRLLTDHCKSLTTSICSILNNGIGCIPTMILALCTSEFKQAVSPEMAVHWTNPVVLIVLVMSAFVGMGVGYFGMEAQRDVSATSFFVMQNVSKIGVVLLGVIVFSDPIKSWIANFGLLLSLGGGFAYGHAQMGLKAETEAEKQKLIKEDGKA